MAQHSTLMSLRGYATSRGMALSTLQHHIKTGKLKTVEGKIDPDYADVCLRSLIDKAQSARGAGQRKKREGEGDEGRSESAFYQLPEGVTDISDIRRLVPRNFMEAQYFNMLEDVQRRRLTNELEEERLVYVDEVTQAQFEIARQIRDAVMAIPSRIADELAAAATPTECARILNRELRTALQAVADAADQIEPDPTPTADETDPPTSPDSATAAAEQHYPQEA